MRRERASWLINRENAPDECKSINNVAVEIGDIGRNILFGYLRKKKILIDSGMGRNTPYRKFIDEGYFVIKHGVVDRTNGPMPIMQTLVTSSGVNFIKELLAEDPIEIRR